MTNTLSIPLTNRSVIRLRGADAETFLQGLLSNDVRKATPHHALYALILTPQGKFLYDFFIIRHDDGLLLECSAARTLEIIKKLGMYKLRSEVSIEDASAQYNVMALTGISNAPEGVIAYVDPRNPALGVRVLLEKNASLPHPTGNYTDYETLRIGLGIPSGDEDMISGEDFPHDFGMDNLNAIDYQKGCYVGQEVTARVHHRGKARKKIYCISLPRPAAKGTAITVGGRTFGSLLSSINGKALALLDQEMVEKEKEPLTIDGTEVTILCQT